MLLWDSLKRPNYPNINRSTIPDRNDITVCTVDPGKHESTQSVGENSYRSGAKITYADHGTVRFLFDIECSEELLQAFENAGMNLGTLYMTAFLDLIQEQLAKYLEDKVSFTERVSCALEYKDYGLNRQPGTVTYAFISSNNRIALDSVLDKTNTRLLDASLAFFKQFIKMYSHTKHVCVEKNNNLWYQNPLIEPEPWYGAHPQDMKTTGRDWR